LWFTGTSQVSRVVHAGMPAPFVTGTHLIQAGSGFERSTEGANVGDTRSMLLVDLDAWVPYVW
jgi:hypothetical protein